MFLSQSLSQLADLDPANHGSEGVFYLLWEHYNFAFYFYTHEDFCVCVFSSPSWTVECAFYTWIFPISSLMLGFLSFQSDMLDVNQIIKDLASMVHEQGDTIGRCHMKNYKLWALLPSSTIPTRSCPSRAALCWYCDYFLRVLSIFCTGRDALIWQAALCNKVLMLWTVCWYI